MLSLSRLRCIPSIRVFKSLLQLVAVFFACAATVNLHAQRELTDIPDPDPVAELAAMHVADGFEVNLFASDPDFSKPIHMNWDAQGRLWIASSQNYPQLKPGAEPNDEIVILEDTDGDGVADKRILFADDMMIPTGVLPGDGGVYVANSTQLIHLSDNDGDGRADTRRTVLSGFGTEDTHHLLHTLRWRPDGRMAMNQSIYIHSHLETPYGVKHLDGGGIWHFNPTTSALEVYCKGFVNPWGHAIDAFGQSLETDGAYGEGINYTFPNAVFVTSPGATRWLSGLNPGSPKHCGLEFVSGDAMPEDMHNVLLTNDFRGHRVSRFQIERSGSGYRSVQLPDLIRSDHIAFRPIDVKMGPDGAIYIADWYNPIIQHGEVDFRDPRRDTEHGRIWRVTAKGKKNLTRPNYADASEPELVSLLADPALWVQQFARQELTRRTPELVDQALEALGDEPHLALQPLWLQLAQGRLSSATLGALRHHVDGRVRAAAIRAIGEHVDTVDLALNWLSEAIDDSDDQVVLEAVCGLQRVGTLDAVRDLLRAAERDGKDQNLNFAIWNALQSSESIWLPAFESGDLSVSDYASLEALADAATTPVVARKLAKQLQAQPASQQARMMELIASRGDAESLATAFRAVVDSELSPPAQAALLEIAIRQSRARNLVPADVAGWLPGVLVKVHVHDAASSPLVTTLANAVEIWHVPQTSLTIRQWLNAGVASNQQAIVGATTGALAQVGSENDRQHILGLANNPNLDSSLRSRAIQALSAFDDDAAAKSVVELYQSHGQIEDSGSLPPQADEAVATILNRKVGVAALTKAISITEASSWTPNAARALLAATRSSSQSDQALETAILTSTGLENAGWKMSSELTQRLVQLSQESGNAVRGEAIYRQERLQCVRCHAIGQSGVTIGPNLVSLGGSATADYIVESLIDPAAKAKEGFQTLNVLLATDEIVTGLQKTKTADALQLLLADGKTRTIPTESIEDVREGKSLMPAGLVDQLTESEMADLLTFLSSLGRVPDYTDSAENWVRNFETLIWTGGAHSRLNRTSFDTVATNDPALSWRVIASQVNGTVPLAETATFMPHKDVPPTAFLRFEIECIEAGDVMLEFSQPTDVLSFWFNGESRPTPTSDQAVALKVGRTQIALGVRTGETDGSLGCKVIPAETTGAIVKLP